MVHCFFGARLVVEQVLRVSENWEAFVPLSVTSSALVAEPPEFLNVNTCEGPLLPATAPKSKVGGGDEVVGDQASTGKDAACPPAGISRAPTTATNTPSPTRCFRCIAFPFFVGAGPAAPPE